MIKAIEQRAGGVGKAYTLLGISKNRWHVYKTAPDQIPSYIRNSIEAHLALSDRAFNQFNMNRGMKQ